MSLPQVDALGRVYVLSAGVPVTWNSGVGYASDGRMCTTNALSVTDQQVGGWRLNATGLVVVAAQNPALVYNGGLPFNNDAVTPGAMASQLDVVPSVNDPYVAGIRVDPLGGVYLTSAAPP